MANSAVFPTPQVGFFEIRKAQKDGVLEAIKEITKERAKNAQKLNALLAKSKSIPLFQLNTFWPLKFFPVRIIINSDRINVAFWTFFSSGQIISLTADIIQEVSLESGPLFSTLKITTNKPMEPIVEISYLKKEQAIKARRIIQGLITATKSEVNLEEIRPQDIATKLEGLGRSQEAEEDIGHIDEKI